MSAQMLVAEDDGRQGALVRRYLDAGYGMTLAAQGLRGQDRVDRWVTASSSYP